MLDLSCALTELVNLTYSIISVNEFISQLRKNLLDAFGFCGILSAQLQMESNHEQHWRKTAAVAVR